jgi:hypothetical protein
MDATWKLEDLCGSWELMVDQSSDIGRFGTLTLDISSAEHHLKIEERWGNGRWNRTLELPVDGEDHSIPIADRVFPANIYTAISYIPGEERTCRATWEDSGLLEIRERFTAAGSQTTYPMAIDHTYTLSPTGAGLKYKASRSSRKDCDINYTFRRKGTGEAWVISMTNDWAIDSGLPERAGIISLQGIVNRKEPRLYLVYPPEWDFKFTPNVLEYLREDRYMAFAELKTLADAIAQFRDHLKGYIVWDKEVRTSLIIAFTLAGLRDAVVITEEQIDLAEANGLEKIEDFRGKFRGQSDFEIYTWAYEQYWDQCSRDYIVWMGGDHGPIMRPGVADWGIYNRAFFTDLSSRPEDAEEYDLACELLSQQNKFSLVFGWHSYKKDTEEQHVSLTSQYSLRVEGLHTLPNMSFSCQIPPTPDFTFRNNHNVEPNETVLPKEKVYIACIQTDCLGIGGWTEPGRGDIPYAWEVTMNWVWLAPAMMEFFYKQSTPNDYFIGALSGPGYMYPRSVPPEDLPQMVDMAHDLMQKLDLRVFEIMEYTDGGFYMGSPDLPKEIVDTYFDGMPSAIGLVNGYGPAYTFTTRDRRPLVSYDYYLSPTQPEADATADIEELAVINPKRPYFLLLHVRNFSDIKRVQRVLAPLGPEFELVPLDVFMKMAGETPTFAENYRLGLE